MLFLLTVILGELNCLCEMNLFPRSAVMMQNIEKPVLLEINSQHCRFFTFLICYNGRYQNSNQLRVEFYFLFYLHSFYIFDSKILYFGK